MAYVRRASIAHISTSVSDGKSGSYGCVDEPSLKLGNRVQQMKACNS